MQTLRAKEDELHIICKILEDMVKNGSIVLLKGDIGSGKTTLVRYFVDSKDVHSPTFNLALAYTHSKYGYVYHYDMYAKSLREMLELGFLDMLERDGLHFVEWGNRELQSLLENNGFAVINISIAQDSESAYRIYKVGDE